MDFYFFSRNRKGRNKKRVVHVRGVSSTCAFSWGLGTCSGSRPQVPLLRRTHSYWNLPYNISTLQTCSGCSYVLEIFSHPLVRLNLSNSKFNISRAKYWLLQGLNTKVKVPTSGTACRSPWSPWRYSTYYFHLHCSCYSRGSIFLATLRCPPPLVGFTHLEQMVSQT